MKQNASLRVPFLLIKNTTKQTNCISIVDCGREVDSLDNSKYTASQKKTCHFILDYNFYVFIEYYNFCTLETGMNTLQNSYLYFNYVSY